MLGKSLSLFIIIFCSLERLIVTVSMVHYRCGLVWEFYPSLWFLFDDMRGRGSIGLREVDELLEELLWVEVVGWGVVGSGEFYVLFRVLWLVVAVQGEGVCFVAGRFLGGLLFDEVVLPVWQCCGPCFYEGGWCNGCDDERQ